MPAVRGLEGGLAQLQRGQVGGGGSGNAARWRSNWPQLACRGLVVSLPFKMKSGGDRHVGEKAEEGTETDESEHNRNKDDPRTPTVYRLLVKLAEQPGTLQAGYSH